MEQTTTKYKKCNVCGAVYRTDTKRKYCPTCRVKLRYQKDINVEAPERIKLVKMAEDLNVKEKEAEETKENSKQEAVYCAECKHKIIGEPQFCSNCGCELDWETSE